jgi:hypothetical protein
MMWFRRYWVKFVAIHWIQSLKVKVCIFLSFSVACAPRINDVVKLKLRMHSSAGFDLSPFETLKEGSFSCLLNCHLGISGMELVRICSTLFGAALMTLLATVHMRTPRPVGEERRLMEREVFEACRLAQNGSDPSQSTEQYVG